MKPPLIAAALTVMLMKKFLLAAIMLLLFALICSCGRLDGDKDTVHRDNDSENKQETALDTATDTVSDSQKESAHIDAINALTMFMSYQALEYGVAVIDDGVIFAVTKNGTQYFFEHNAGELSSTSSPTLSQEVTPVTDTWPTHVQVYMP